MAQTPTSAPQSAQPAQHASRVLRLSLAWRQRLIILLFGLTLIGVVGFTLSWHNESSPVAKQSAGEPALQDVIAQRGVSYDSSVGRTAAADKAAAAAPIIYARDTEGITKKQAGYARLVERIATDRALYALTTIYSERESLTSGLQRLVAHLSAVQVTHILSVSDDQWQAIRRAGQETQQTLLALEVKPGNENDAFEKLRFGVYVPASLSPMLAILDEDDRSIVRLLVEPFIGATQVRDDDATKKGQEDARSKVPAVPVTIIAGQTIARRGDILAESQLEMMDHLGLRSDGFDPLQTSGTIGLVALLVVALLAYFARTGSFGGHTDTGLRPSFVPRLRFKLLLFLALAFWIAAVAARFTLSSALIAPASFLNGVQQFIFPLATIAMMLAVLFDLELAIFFSALVALMTGFVGNGIEPAALYFAGGFAGALTIWRAERISDFTRAGLAVIVAEFLTATFFGLAQRDLSPVRVVQLAGATTINGLLSTSLAFFGFSVLGRLFGVTTVLQLLELAHPTQPLLKRLMREAPGTYHHSMLVGTLAEQAAGAIGADPLLARVGAYFHDIGKLSDPHMFIENQEGGPNPHDDLDPNGSRDVLMAHVTDGVKLARKYGLPRRIADIIGQHHGVSVMSYFYDRALKENMAVSESDFRYPGPRPQTKEAAIVMLSDGVEAAVRAGVQSGQIAINHDPTPTASNALSLPGNSPPKKTIRSVVDQIIEDRITDGQLDECDLTLRDITTIRRIFTTTLGGIYHARVVYPEKQANAAQPVPPSVVRVLSPESPADGSRDSIEQAMTIVPAAPPIEEPITDQPKPPKPTTRIGRAGSSITAPLSEPADKRQESA